MPLTSKPGNRRNQSINQPTNQSINQPVNPSINRINRVEADLSKRVDAVEVVWVGMREYLCAMEPVESSLDTHLSICPSIRSQPSPLRLQGDGYVPDRQDGVGVTGDQP